MGRYVSGDWSWKFAFGDQSSSFGEVLEKVTSKTEDCYTSRYVGTQKQGEMVELYVENWDQMANAIAGFIGPDFKIKSDAEMEAWSKLQEKYDDDYWDKVMMWKFLKEMYDKGTTCEYYNFSVEY